MATRQEKAPGAFRTISEVAEELDVPQHVLRFWESKFNQLKPVKRGGGRRYYRPEDVALIRAIRKLLYDDKFTIKGAQKLFREQGVRKVVTLAVEGAAALELTDRDDESPDGADPLSTPANGPVSYAPQGSGTTTLANGHEESRANKVTDGADSKRLHALLRELRAARDLLSGEDSEPR